jgi:hypothetical protein
VIVDSTRLSYTAENVMQQRYYPAAGLFAEMRDALVERERPVEEGSSEDDRARPHDERLVTRTQELEREVLRISSVSAHHQALWEGMMDSASWRVTSPIRAVAALTRRATGRAR